MAPQVIKPEKKEGRSQPRLPLQEPGKKKRKDGLQKALFFLASLNLLKLSRRKEGEASKALACAKQKNAGVYPFSITGVVRKGGKRKRVIRLALRFSGKKRNVLKVWFRFHFARTMAFVPSHGGR